MASEEPTPDPSAASNAAGSVTRLLSQLRQGTPQEQRKAYDQLSDRFFDRLVECLRPRLRGLSEDMVVEGVESAVVRINTFVGRHAWIQHRGELWAILLKVAGKRAYNKLRTERRQKKHFLASELPGPTPDGTLSLDDLAADDAPASWEGHVLSLLERVRDKPEGPEWEAVVEAVGELVGQCPAGLGLREILLWLAQGHTQEEIAEKIQRKKSTVCNRIRLLRNRFLEERT